MANPTASHTDEPARQAHTPGVSPHKPGVPAAGPMGGAPPGISGGVPQTPDTPPAKPVLFEDIDQVLLLRLYPEAKGDARLLAEKAGQQAYADGLKLVAAQQEPVAPL